MRGDPPQFTLVDDVGTQVGEFASFDDAVVSGRDLHEIVVFPPLPKNATTAVLSIECVRVSEFTGAPVRLAVPSETDIELGGYRAHARVTRGEGFRGDNVVRIELDDGGWHDDRRLVYAESVRIDGAYRGVARRGDLEPPVTAESEDPTGAAAEVTLESPVVELRGPLRFEIPLP